MPARLLTVAAMLGAIAVLGWPQASQAISLVPPTLEFSTQPGQTLTGRVKVYNDTKDFQTYYLSTSNFTAGGETGEPKFDFTTDVSDLADWIKPDVNQLDLQPGGQASINLSIAVPTAASPGGHYAGVFFGTTPPDAGNVRVQQRTGTLVILRVEGDIREAAQVAQFAVADSQGSGSHLPISLVLRVQNTGNTHFRPKGFVTIRNMFGGVAATIDVNPKEGAVLPDSVRRFDLTWKKDAASLPAANFFGQVGQEWNNFAFGAYTADLAATYGTTNQNLTAALKVVVVPWRLLLLIVVLLAIVILILTFGIRRYNAAIVKRAERQLKQPNNNPPKL
ncbi:MAG: hypothetical protein AAB402_03360 [Patescibacteria group bacterium]